MWGMMVYFLYRMRRVQCVRCGVKVERVPWANGKSSMTKEYQWFLAGWARRMSWLDVSEMFHVSWSRVYESVKQAVSWGLGHRNLDGIEALGVDEVLWKRGHQYQTVVYQLDTGCKRLLWIGKDRASKTLLGFFSFLSRDLTTN
jgi:transposase